MFTVHLSLHQCSYTDSRQQKRADDSTANCHWIPDWINSWHNFKRFCKEPYSTCVHFKTAILSINDLPWRLRMSKVRPAPGALLLFPQWNVRWNVNNTYSPEPRHKLWLVNPAHVARQYSRETEIDSCISFWRQIVCRSKKPFFFNRGVPVLMHSKGQLLFYACLFLCVGVWLHFRFTRGSPISKSKHRTLRWIG